MPANYSSKRISDGARFARWDAMPDSVFAAHGTTRAAVKAVQAQMQGHIVFKGEAGYDSARQIFNPLFNAYPGAIAYCVTETDVAHALALGQVTTGGFCLRSGGHSTAGYSTGSGLVIDVSALDQVVVDSTNLVASVGCGCNFGKLYQTLEPYGLHVPAGECPDVCVGGFVQGGGYGFTSVSYGLNCDNALRFRVMLADGSIVQADAGTNADLFWALRGGTGGNFGIVLSVDYQLRKLGQVAGFALLWPLSTPADVAQATTAMMALQANFMVGAPNLFADMNMQVSLCFQNHIDPSQPPPPPGTPLLPYLMVRGMWLGQASALPSILRPLTMLPGCVVQWIASDTFRSMNDKLLNYPQGMPDLDQMPFEDKSSRYIDRALTAAEWSSLLALFSGAPNNMAYGYGEFYGGAINQVGTLDTAFVHRGAVMNMVMDVYWLLNGDRAACETFLANWTSALEPLSNGESYQNYPSPDEVQYIDRYWGPAYPFLQLVKAKYDPGNAFAFPQQVYADPGLGQKPPPDPRLPAAVTAAVAQPVTRVLAAMGG